MSNLQEKLAFSERLKQALIDSNHPISPTYLSKEFNHRYDGAPVSVQSANNWLLGKAIPNQDKLAILSIWLNVTSQWLRFGDNTLGSSNLESNDQSELDYFLKFRTLNASQKQIIKDLIDQFIQR
ncbi:MULTISPECIES: hypothetical protein [Acinetobacter]|uniref:hypothetical protein n=1 Tax=Acinetobacter TaxID=469 RepID=UPI0015D3CA72|nr:MULTISPECIES: hypothetical protein [Acinetobacter]MCL6232947.1 hypothetical protein [Acinetobacter amyesii]UUS64376.1 hypothetical protein MST18_10990 [Acinetobacter sp. YH12068_T]